MKIHKWLARRFGYTRFLEKEIDSLRDDRAKLLDHVSQEDAQHFLNRTGWAMPDEFGWDPEGYIKYRQEVENRKANRLGSRLKPSEVGTYRVRSIG